MNSSLIKIENLVSELLDKNKTTINKIDTKIENNFEDEKVKRLRLSSQESINSLLDQMKDIKNIDVSEFNTQYDKKQ